MGGGPSWPGGHVWTRDPIVVLDTETTGLDAQTHSIVELALLRVEGLREVDFLWALLNPGPERLEAFAKSRAAEVNGLDPGELLRADALADLAPEVLHFLGEHPVLAYNAPFDAAFLRAELGRLGRPVPPNLAEGRQLDPLVWVRDVDRFVSGKPYRARGLRRHSLGPTAERRGLRPVGDLHRATTDARLLLALAKRLALREGVPGWTARLLRRQEGRRAAQDAERREFRASRVPR